MDNYIVKRVSHYCNISVERCSLLPSIVIPYYDLTFVLDGSLTYIADGKKYVLNKNDVLFLTPGTYRERPLGTAPVKYVCFNFYIEDDASLTFDTFMPKAISTTIRKLVTVFPHSHIMPSYHSREKIANILNYILLELLDFEKFTSSNEHIIKIIKYIDENIKEKITLQTIHEHMHLSSGYISNIFKKETGKTLTDYVNERKMFIAKEMITSNEMSLTETAEQLGFENYNYFSRLFNKYYGTRPLALRKRGK